MIVSFDLDHSIRSSVTQDILLHSEFFLLLSHTAYGEHFYFCAFGFFQSPVLCWPSNHGKRTHF